MAADFSQDRLTETFKSLITLSIEGFRYLALVNGGAVVALLAYLGNVAKNGTPVPDLTSALTGFLVGLVACGIALFAAYLTQFFLLNDLLANKNQEEQRHKWMVGVAAVAFVVSLAAFCWGAREAVSAFSALEDVPKGALTLLEGAVCAPAHTVPQAPRAACERSLYGGLCPWLFENPHANSEELCAIRAQ